jgi:hypothetical protein
MKTKNLPASVMETSMGYFQDLQRERHGGNLPINAMINWTIYAGENSVVNAVVESVLGVLGNQNKPRTNCLDVNAIISICYSSWCQVNPGRKIEIDGKEGEAPEIFTDFWLSYSWAFRNREGMEEQ